MEFAGQIDWIYDFAKPAATQHELRSRHSDTWRHFVCHTSNARNSETTPCKEAWRQTPGVVPQMVRYKTSNQP